MTKIALIGTGPCGLSFLRSLHQAKKNGDSSYDKVKRDHQCKGDVEEHDPRMLRVLRPVLPYVLCVSL